MLKEYVGKHRKDMLKTWEELHAIPEWGCEEYKTSAYLKKELEARGFTVTPYGKTGFTVEIKGAEEGPVIGLRADMDALPYKDEKGETYYLHTCGHDSHCTMGMWTAIALKELGLVKKGTVRFLFQPAEEKLLGAIELTKLGAIDDLDELYGVHIRPIQEVPCGKAAPALWHGASCKATIVVHGTAAHGARPHLGANAIDGAAAIVFAINSLWLDPGSAWSAKVTKMEAGGAAMNIIPDKATMFVDMRAGTNPLMQELISKIKSIVPGAAASMGCTVDVDFTTPSHAAEYDADCTKVLAKAIGEALGAENVAEEIVTVGADDFHEYKALKPELKTAFLALGADAKPGLHAVDMTFNTEAIMLGVDILVRALAERTK